MNQLSQSHRVTGVAIDRENREKDDFYPTPPEATDALLSRETFVGEIWEPACGDGAISAVLAERGYSVVSTDLVNRGYGVPRVDFLMEQHSLAPNIVTNPPFKMVAPFMRQAIHLSTSKVAFLLRLACLEGADRRKIYDQSPLARVWVFSKRLTMHTGGGREHRERGNARLRLVRLGAWLYRQAHARVAVMRRVILESPLAGNVSRNVAYARACARDCLSNGDAPFASHLLYAQDGILDDNIPEERELGIEAGLLWGQAAMATVIYTDLGISLGMERGIESARKRGRKIEYRKLPNFAALFPKATEAA